MKIEVKQQFHASGDVIWNAITNPEMMRKWFFEAMPDFKPMVGFKTEFMVHTPNASFLHQWEVITVVPGKMISYRWKYGDYEGTSIVNFVLKSYKEDTLLSFSHSGIESFPSSVPEFSKKSCSDGWTYFINFRLPAFIEGLE